MTYQFLFKSNNKIFLISIVLAFFSILFTIDSGVGFKIKVTARINHFENLYFKGRNGLGFLPSLIEKLHTNNLDKKKLNKKYKIKYFDCNAVGFFTECAGAIYTNFSIFSIKKDIELINYFYKDIETGFDETQTFTRKHILYKDFVENIDAIEIKNLQNIYLSKFKPFNKIIIKPVPFFKKNLLENTIYIKTFLLVLIIIFVTVHLAYNIHNKIYHNKD